MLEARFVPLDTWPAQATKARKNSQFKATYIRTLDKLEAELDHLRAKNILIQAFFSSAQIRNDGWPKAGQRPSSPGVILTFDSARGTLSFPCDTYTGYEDNLRAIALALEALRAVDRYGVTSRAEQYRGWLRIEPPADQPFANAEAAAAFICDSAGVDRRISADIITDAETRYLMLRSASRTLHPDAPTGSHEMFVRLQAAAKLLEPRKAGA